MKHTRHVFFEKRLSFRFERNGQQQHFCGKDEGGTGNKHLLPDRAESEQEEEEGARA